MLEIMNRIKEEFYYIYWMNFVKNKINAKIH